MQKFVKFWKKDLVNKLITLVALLIVTAVVVDLVLLMVPKSDGTALLDDFFPTPTLELKVIQTQQAATAEYRSAMATASVPPTVTTMPLKPVLKATTFFQIYSTPMLETPQPTITPTLSLPTSTAQAQTPTPSRTPQFPPTTPAAGAACIPNNPPQTGKVVEILDGNTVKVLVNGLVYVVRYIGVKPPADQNYATLTNAKNGELVFLKEVTLTGDGADKDPTGRLLRYVSVGDIFVNLELIRQGLASADDAALQSSCSQVFQDAEAEARAAGMGIWGIAPAVLAP
jgi:endonuclease YncB( thermonuclease family)